jgi:hypothetical protein
MPPSQRLADLEELIETNYQKLAKFQSRLDRTASVREEFDIEGDIPKIRKAIRSYEAEYWNLLAQEARIYEVEENEANRAIVEVQAQVLQVIESQPNLNDELMQKLQVILGKLNESETPVAAKAMLALPLIPGILSYEVELDTENLLRRAFDPIKNLCKRALQKK